MAEKYSVSEAARKIGISRRALYNWLAQEPEASQHLHGERTFTRIQLERLAEKHGRRVQSDFRDLEAVDSALTERIEAVERRLEALEARQGHLSSVTRQATPAPSQAHTEAFLLPPRTASAGGITRTDAARLVSARHGVNFNTCKGWPWPIEALASQDAVMRWALGYVAERPPHKRPAGWRPRCSVIGCPCHEG